MASLYLHIPFCKRKCAYCDFASFEEREADVARYISALIGDIEKAASTYGKIPVETVFFGGGTPSLLSGAQICALMDAVRSGFSFMDDAEVTLEANPGTLIYENLLSYRRAGINRLSVGIQSFDGEMLWRIGRIHTPREAADAVRMASGAGFENISVDLIYGLPGQSVEKFMESVDSALSLPVSHISLYALIVEAGTPIAGRIGRSIPELPDEEEVLRMQHEAQTALMRAGFFRYEISNYAKMGMECRHNLVYWMRGEYLGLGCAAHSLMCGERFEITDNLSEYLNGRREILSEALTKEAQLEEVIMLSTRTREGIDLQMLKKQFGLDLLSEKADEIERLGALGLLRVSDGFIALTDAGFDVHNAVVLALL